VENIQAVYRPDPDGCKKSIVALIPAHNEAARVGEVINVVKKIDSIDRIIVIDDGSEDNTSDIARLSGAEVLKLESNRGKAYAMDHGVNSTDEPILLFLDADLIFLDEKHILDLLQPVVDGDADMTMGVFRNGRFRTDIAHRISPGLSGQRAMLRSVWNLLDHSRPMEKVGYGIENELQSLVRNGSVRFKKVDWVGVSQYTKEEKLGTQKGFKLRMKMYQDIIKAWTRRMTT
jgi:glycosyltransferase involved in cell wall biosynthesis